MSGHFARVSVAAIHDLRLDAQAVRVLSVIASFADQGGRCWPSQGKIAERLGLSLRSINGHVAKLIKCGYLVAEMRTRPGRGRTSNVYTLQFPASTAENLTPERDAAVKGMPPSASARALSSVHADADLSDAQPGCASAPIRSEKSHTQSHYVGHTQDCCATNELKPAEPYSIDDSPSTPARAREASRVVGLLVAELGVDLRKFPKWRDTRVLIKPVAELLGHPIDLVKFGKAFRYQREKSGAGMPKSPRYLATTLENIAAEGKRVRQSATMTNLEGAAG